MELLVYASEMFRQINQTDCSSSDLKSTTLTGRSFHTFTTLMLKKEVLALQPLNGYTTYRDDPHCLYHKNHANVMLQLSHWFTWRWSRSSLASANLLENRRWYLQPYFSLPTCCINEVSLTAVTSCLPLFRRCQSSAHCRFSRTKEVFRCSA